MSNCISAIDELGGPALFLGVETHDWTLAQFDAAASFAKDHALSTLIVKVFDGPNEWYGGIGGFDAIKKTIEAHGIKALPYGYLYGNAKGSSLATELGFVEKYMNGYGWCMADMESEWSGHVDWANTMNNRLAMNTNLLYVSPFADPNERNESGVLAALAPSVNAWIPQVYDAFLYSVFVGEFNLLKCIIPVIDLSNEFGTNDPVLYASSLLVPIVVWEYQFAIANPSLLDKVISASKGAPKPMAPLSSTGEIADFCDADQFQPSKTQDACGFFATAIVDAATPVGKPCAKTVAQVIAEAEQWYAQYNGDNSISNNFGMSLDQLYRLLGQLGLHYYALPLDVNRIRVWVKAGYPVIIAGAESGMFDMGLGDRVPYYWNVSGLNHIITATGVTSDGNFLVRDSANVTDLFNPSSLRPGPRKYDASKLQLISATAVVMHGQPLPNLQGGIPMPVPSGWHDDGTTLTAPNNMSVRMGFRNTIINAASWDAGNVPLAPEEAVDQVLLHGNFGKGTRQFFRDSLLWWTPTSGVINESQLGAELYAYEQALVKEQQALIAAQQALAPAQQQIASLQQQLNDALAKIQQLEQNPPTPTPVPTIPADLQAAVNSTVTGLDGLSTALKPFVK